MGDFIDRELALSCKIADSFTINPMTLSPTVKELKENNDDIMPDWLEGLIRVYEQTTVRVTKSR